MDSFVQQRVKNNMKGSMQFEVEYVKKIEPLASGKYCVVINEVASEA